MKCIKHKLHYLGYLCLLVAFFLNEIAVAEAKIPQYTISITSPKSEETFQNDTQALTITVNVMPDLAEQDKVVIFLDGTPTSEPVHSTSITLPPVERGSHVLQAKVIQPRGKGAESETILFYQQRHSIFSPT